MADLINRKTILEGLTFQEDFTRKLLNGQPAEVQALPHPRRIVRRVEKAKRLPMRPHGVAQRAFRKCSAMRGEDFRVLPRNAQPRGKELQGADARMHTQIFAADFPFEHFQQAVQSRVAGNQHGGTLSCVAG